MEQIFELSKKPIKYIFEQSSNPSDYMLVIFSAFSTKGAPPEYNYYNTLFKYDCNKLFILDDYGLEGCYYLGENRDFTVEESVISLIRYICTQENIDSENILACGTSKGGYSALYFSIKYNFGHAVVGAPQSLLGNFLASMDSKKNTLYYIAGNNSNDSIQFLNKLIFDVISKTEKFPNIFIHVGKEDYHYKDHVRPLIDAINKKGYHVNIDLGDFSSHNEISFYQRYLEQNIKEIVRDYAIKTGHPNISNLIIDTTTDENNQYVIKAYTKAEGDKLKFAWYVYKDDQKHYVEWYKDSCEMVWKPDTKGKYRILAFVKDQLGKIDHKTSDYNYF